MKIADNASIDDNTHGGGEIPPCTGLTPDAFPEVQEPVLAENSQTGVSTRNALSGTYDKPSGETKSALAIPRCEEGRANGSTDGSTPLTTIMRKPKEVPHWYALRVTYGREKRAYDYLVGKHVEAYDNINLPYLRFYYKHTHTGARIMKTPLIVPDNQIKSLQIICEKEGSDTLVLQEEVTKFKQGEKVKIIEGDFAGVTGIVARYHGQQRVGLVIDGLLTAVTAYIPTAFLQAID